MQPIQPAASAASGTTPGSPRSSNSPVPSDEDSAPKLSDTPRRKAVRRLFQDETDANEKERGIPVGEVRLSAPRLSLEEDLPRSPYRPPRRPREACTTTTTSLAATTTTTTTTITTTTSITTTTAAATGAISSRSALDLRAGGSRSLSPIPEQASPSHRHPDWIDDARLFDDAQLWAPTEAQLIDSILRREKDALIADESGMIALAARQPSTLALEILLQAERALVFAPYTPFTRRGWYAQDCPFLAAIQHECPHNLQLLLRHGVRPGPALEMILSSMPSWVKDIFRQYDYML